MFYDFMEISEIFYSIQGEGPEIGKKVIFVRLAKCNLRCKFCDTKYAWRGKKLRNEEIVDNIKKYSCKSIVWTGGEPTIQRGVSNIIYKLKNYSHDLETNGTFYFQPKLFKTVVISPKKQAINKNLIKKYKDFDNVYFKFVVEDLKNYNFWKNLIGNMGIKKSKVYFMPEAKNKKTLLKNIKWLLPLINKDGFNFSNRLQIIKNFH